MIRSRFFSGFLVPLLFAAMLLSVAYAQSKQPTQKEVAEYIKLIDAKITFNKAQHNTAKAKQLQAEKKRTLSRWKSLKKKTAIKKAGTVKKSSAKKAPVMRTAASSAAKIPSTQQGLKDHMQTIDAQIASYKAQGNASKVKALRIQKQKALKKLQALQRKQAKQKKVPLKSKAAGAVKLTDLEGPIGTWLNNGHASFRVINAEFKDSDPRAQKPPEGTRFFVVTVEIKNKDPFTAVYGGDYHRVMVIDANRVYYMENVAKNPINWADNEDIKELMTNESFETAYVFTIPSEAVPDKLVFDASAADKYPVMRVLLR